MAKKTLEKIGTFLGLIEAYDEMDEELQGQKPGADMNKVFIFHPEKLNDVSQMVDFLKQGTICVVNLSSADIDAARSIKDHMQGATFYAGGTVEYLAESLFMFLPKHYESKKYKLDTKQIMDTVIKDSISTIRTTIQ